MPDRLPQHLRLTPATRVLLVHKFYLDVIHNSRVNERVQVAVPEASAGHASVQDDRGM
jgi:hypothetical protein